VRAHRVFDRITIVVRIEASNGSTQPVGQHDRNINDHGDDGSDDRGDEGEEEEEEELEE
jgi:hypothetical protein